MKVHQNIIDYKNEHPELFWISDCSYIDDLGFYHTLFLDMFRIHYHSSKPFLPFMEEEGRKKCEAELKEAAEFYEKQENQ
jgi:hypothetical protein